MRYVVKAVSLNPRTGQQTSSARDEVIDTDNNRVFAGLTSPWDIEDRYEAFWNRLNDSWERDFPADKDKVKVLSVVPETS